MRTFREVKVDGVWKTVASDDPTAPAAPTSAASVEPVKKENPWLRILSAGGVRRLWQRPDAVSVTDLDPRG